jgi:hypothetical protein
VTALLEIGGSLVVQKTDNISGKSQTSPDKSQTTQAVQNLEVQPSRGESVCEALEVARLQAKSLTASNVFRWRRVAAARTGSSSWSEADTWESKNL